MPFRPAEPGREDTVLLTTCKPRKCRVCRHPSAYSPFQRCSSRRSGDGDGKKRRILRCEMRATRGTCAETPVYRSHNQAGTHTFVSKALDMQEESSGPTRRLTAYACSILSKRTVN